MKLLLRTMLLFTLFAPASLVTAHSDHGTISEQSAIQIASKTVQQMTFRDLGYQAGKLDASWKSVRASDIEVIDFKEGFYLLRVINKETNQSVLLKIAATGKVLEAMENYEN